MRQSPGPVYPQGIPANIATRPSGRLKDWTGRSGSAVANGQGGGETLIEQEPKADASLRAEVEADLFVQAVTPTFDGTALGEFKALALLVELPVIRHEGADDTLTSASQTASAVRTASSTSDSGRLARSPWKSLIEATPA